MTREEFSNEFDVLYNNIMSNQAPGLDEYEKSVFLTKAQLEILKNYFNPKGNKYGQGFDENAKRQIDFSSLIKTVKPSIYTPDDTYVKFDDRSALYKLPSDILLVLNENGITEVSGKKNLISIVPMNYEEYARLMSKPFKQPLKNQGWRLFQTIGDIRDDEDMEANFISEVIVQYSGKLSDYKIRYVKRPKPIILTNLRDGFSNVSIDGLQTPTECELDPIIHSEILQRAVELAKAAYAGDLKSSVDLGQRSE